MSSGYMGKREVSGMHESMGTKATEWRIDENSDDMEWGHVGCMRSKERMWGTKHAWR